MFTKINNYTKHVITEIIDNKLLLRLTNYFFYKNSVKSEIRIKKDTYCTEIGCIDNYCFCLKEKYFNFNLFKTDSVAQLVEQQTLNLWVLSSNLSGVTNKKI